MGIESSTFAKTIIVGAGAAGMNAALELQKAGENYLVVTEDVGGRIRNDADAHMNYGAVFYFGNYHHMLDPEKNIIQPTVDVIPSLSAAAGNDGPRQWSAISAKTLADAPSMIRYMRWMRKVFLPHYEHFKLDCEKMQVSAALAADPLMDKLYHQSASDFIREMRFEPICRDLVSMFAHACTGTPPQKLSALDYLNCVQPLTLKMPSMKQMLCLRRFDFDKPGMTERLGQGCGAIKIASVTRVERAAEQGDDDAKGRWRIRLAGAGDELTCENLILATPADVTARLLAPIDGIPPIEVRQASVLYAYHLDAKIKEHYSHHVVHIFNEKTPIIFIARRNDGTYEIFTEVDFEADGGRKMDEHFDEWTIKGKVFWPRALFTNPNIVTDQNPAEGLILAGDQNGLGMEPAAISGVYAANKVLGRTTD